MIFEHPETGLRVVVQQVDHCVTYKTKDGETFPVETLKELRTEAGQPCIPWNESDDLLKIGVQTGTRMICLVRVD